MIFDYLHYLAIILFGILNFFVFYKIYQLKLKYLSPSLGYASSLLILAVLTFFSFFSYNAVAGLMEEPKDDSLVKIRVEYLLNKFADKTLSDEEMAQATKELMQNFSEEGLNVKIIDAQGVFLTVKNQNTYQVDAKGLMGILKFTKHPKQVKVNHIHFNMEQKVDFLELSM